MKSTLGIVGLGVMGQNLSRNLARAGYKVSLYNRRIAGKEEDVALTVINTYPELSDAKGFEEIEAFVQSISKPRKIILMITAGKAVDHMLNSLLSYLSPNDIIIDGGNSFFKDSCLRFQEAGSNGIHWVSMGVSGGAEGALLGPSLMPSGDSKTVNSLLPILQSIAAKDEEGKPCCINIGKECSGHFVKMVHNGIEYGEMQLIAEVYDLLHVNASKSYDEIADIFKDWSKKENQSYLLDISREIIQYEDSSGNLLDQILDVAKGKGTGVWTSNTAAEMGVPVPLIQASVNERAISAFETLRKDLAQKIHWPEHNTIPISVLEQAYYCSRIINHIQGIELIRIADDQYGWGIDLSELARVWTNGCIIRSQLMVKICRVLQMKSMLFESVLVEEISQGVGALKKTISSALEGPVALPAMSSALNYLKSISRERGPMNLIQAQRDYFGSHKYQKIADRKFYTTDWKKK